MKSGTYSLISIRVCMTFITSVETILHQNYLCLRHKYHICDIRNALLILLHITLGLTFLHLKYEGVKVDIFIYKSEPFSSKLTAKTTDLVRK